MAGLKGLGKGERPEQEENAERFISGVNDRINVHVNKPKRERIFKTYTFSLTEVVSEEIDDLLDMIPRKQRASRSDIVKAAIHSLKLMDKEQLNDLVIQVMNNK